MVFFGKDESKKSIEKYRRLNELEREGFLRWNTKGFERSCPS